MTADQQRNRTILLAKLDQFQEECITILQRISLEEQSVFLKSLADAYHRGDNGQKAVIGFALLGFSQTVSIIGEREKGSAE